MSPLSFCSIGNTLLSKIHILVYSKYGKVYVAALILQNASWRLYGLQGNAQKYRAVYP